MKSDVEQITSKYGKNNPFSVPEGYFEALPSQIMDRLPERKLQKRSAVSMIVRPLLYAACFAAAIFTVVSVFNRNNADADTATIAAVSTTSAMAIDNTDSDELMDYTMMDNMDIYACLASDIN